ncbi:nucleotide sugar dehydrogenase [Desulforamulus ferrireducens]|uniref:UDP-N-acetyl-D-glucosamine dehydrogenase n=1 Tax=Desulforamulus ferrireducens TaxID=1833852 RepID=A0A1S6J008_9FIRM|nr:nucleotide sugar dehydrogenase [Desulforamulus ferrireducens]AQS60363.1 UDP-N-acetyl-D-glucosamine dehydrogenase [Desulforamulus ferrireducens]
MSLVEVQDIFQNDYQKQLISKITNRTAKVAVVGLGYVGLPLAVEKAKVGFEVIGIDQNRRRATMVNEGINYIKDVKDHELKELVEAKKIKATHEFEVLTDVDVIVICVPTPLSKNMDPDISYIENVTHHISEHLKPGQLVTLESTTYPGTTQEVILPRLERTGLKVGKDFFLSFSPERVDPGNKRFTTKNTSKVVGGVTPACLEIAKVFYEQTILEVVPVSSPAVAEMTKVFENTYRAVNIALVNELTLLCDRMGINVWEVLDAAATKPFGIQIFYPGPGVGGHCIPIDPHYLTWKAREYDFHTRFIELAAEINMHMPYYVIQKVTRAINDLEKSLRGSNILVMGVAYKKDIDDERESPALKVIELLLKDGARVSYYDSYIPEFRLHNKEATVLKSVELTEEVVKEADCVLIITDHSNVDYNWLAEKANLIVDTRNATKYVTFSNAKIVRI